MTRADYSAVVTGGASGLGLATTRMLAARGARVVIADLPGVADPGLPGATLIEADVTSVESIREAIACAAGMAPLRVAVACAGVAHNGRVLGSTGRLKIDDFEQVVRVNLTGTAALLIESAAVMADNEPANGDRGVIVCTASIAAFDGGSVAYSASKAGVAGMVLPAAQNLAPAQIRVIGIAPGLFATPMVEGMPPVLQQIVSKVPHPSRLGEGHEFAQLVGQIIDNPMLNGENVRLDGALRMTPPGHERKPG